MEPGWECRKYGNQDGNAENQGEMMGIKVGMRGTRVEMRRVRVGMMGIRVGMMGIRVGMMGISVVMWGTGGGNEGNKGENLRIGVELMNYKWRGTRNKKLRVSCYSVNVQRHSSIGVVQKSVLQKRSKFTGDRPCRSVISVKLHSKNSSVNLRFWECGLV